MPSQTSRSNCHWLLSGKQPRWKVSSSPQFGDVRAEHCLHCRAKTVQAEEVGFVILANHRKAQQPPLIRRILASCEGECIIYVPRIIHSTCLGQASLFQVGHAYVQAVMLLQTNKTLYLPCRSSEMGCNCCCRHAAIASII